ncbi:hypothetical protein [Tabrizicola sp.]|uniref:hypothetical protein n=1 Tax=Tabrizicola sp. TaxID=2005166 RepID=UPI0035B4A2EF
MFTRVASHLRNRADWLMSGQFDRVTAGYRYPFPVWLGAGPVIVRTPAEAESMLVLQRALYLKRGVFALVPRIAALELPRGRGIRVWVDWEERAQSPEESRCASTIYYLTAESAGLMIEMVQNLTLTMPEFRPHFASLALSA